jgi:hypothetical protein
VPKKPKKVAKVKRSKEWKRRSQASKKGWKARKLKKEILDTRRQLPEISKKLPKRLRDRILPRANPLPGLKTPVDERIAELEKRNRELETYREWIRDSGGPEWEKLDGTIAKYPSTLRTYERRVQEKAYGMLEHAALNGHLEEEVLKIARLLELPLREVYAFFYSP